MASLNPQTLVNDKKSYFLEVPVPPTGLPFAGPTPVTIINDNGILKTNTGDILNDSRWSDFPASSGHIDVSGPAQRITATDSQLFFNGQALGIGGNVADWSYYPADSGFIDFSGPNQRITATDTNLVYNGVPLTGGSLPNWALYPAVANVDMNSKNLENCAEVKTDKISDRTGNLLINPIGNLNQTADNVTITASNDLVTPSLLTLQTTSGTYGDIEITANSGTNGNGRINLTANAGRDPTGETGYGGNIVLTANSIVGDLITFTSSIKSTAASILSYAGAIPPLFGVAGYNFIFGNVGVSLVCDVLGSILPNFPGTVYLFGRLGVAVQTSTFQTVNYGLFCNDIQPFSDGIRPRGDLVIQGKENAKVILRNTKEIAGDSLTVTGLTSINTTAYVPTQSWATIPASQNVSLNGKSITNCVNINTDTINGLVLRPYLQQISTPFLVQADAIGYIFLYQGTSTNMVFTNQGQVEGFYFRFINGNSASLDMNVSMAGTNLGVAQFNRTYTITYVSFQWKMFD
jgi:hypothetical protein